MVVSPRMEKYSGVALMSMLNDMAPLCVVGEPAPRNPIVEEDSHATKAFAMRAAVFRAVNLCR